MTTTSPLLPEYLPGEPVRRVWTFRTILLALLVRLITVAVLWGLFWPLWPVYGIFRLFFQRPPHLPAPARVGRVLFMALRQEVEPPGLTAWARAALVLRVLQHLALAPLKGLAWFLDELMYGQALQRVTILEPLFEISAARSGSTQLAHYLEDDPHICAPNLLQTAFPYLWLWKLARRLEGPFFSKDRLSRLVASSLPPEYVQRHELDPFRIDTFEIIFLITAQLGEVLMSLGPRATLGEISAAQVNPANRAFWEEAFLPFLDAIGRKTLAFAPTGPEGQARRLMIKGHFLAVADQLEARYPGARFLTVLRAPDKRLQSVINFHRCHATEPLCGPVPWSWLVQHAVEAEPAYCQAEQAWFSRPSSTRRCIIRFDQFVRDLEGTMRKLYLECLDLQTLPPHVPRVHAPRVRTEYSVDRSLEQLGVDVAWLNSHLEAYRRWCSANPS